VRLGGLDRVLPVGRTLEPCPESVQPPVGLAVLRLGVLDVLADDLEVGAEPLEVLTQLNDTAQSDGFKLWITGVGGELDRVFRITGLDQVLPLVERVPDPGA